MTVKQVVVGLVAVLTVIGLTALTHHRPLDEGDRNGREQGNPRS